MAVREIAPGVFVETEHLGSNNSIVSTPEGLVLIDLPHRPTDAMRWRRVAASMGETAFIINTDHHIDHSMGNRFVPGLVVGHELTRRQLIENAPGFDYVRDLVATIDPEGLPLVQDYVTRAPTITFSDRMALDMGGGLRLELIHLPGHTPNSTYVTLDAYGILFSGDLFCELGLPAFAEACVHDWLEAVRFLETVDADWIVPGHGQVSRPSAVTPFREAMENLIGEVEHGIERGDDRASLAETIRFEDRIHVSTGGSPAYPDYLIERFQRQSIETIHDQILERRDASNLRRAQLRPTGETP